MIQEEVLDTIKSTIGDKSEISVSPKDSNMLVIHINDITPAIKHKKILSILRILKDNKKLRFTILTDLFAADFPSRTERFEVVYNLLSLQLNLRIIVKTSTSENEALPSASDIFSAATWYEREIYDMFGITFDNNPDQRRILTDYGFIGHPLRKDFPLTGHAQVRYDESLKKVIYEPVVLQQEFRDFDFLSPWGGPTIPLPGDEKAKNN